PAARAAPPTTRATPRSAAAAPPANRSSRSPAPSRSRAAPSTAHWRRARVDAIVRHETVRHQDRSRGGGAAMALEFGIFDHQERRRDVPLGQQYEQRLELVEEADRLGFYGYHLAEHHQSPLCMSPSQSIFLAAAAQRTRRLLLGGLVYLLPMHHPVRLIE